MTDAINFGRKKKQVYNNSHYVSHFEGYRRPGAAKSAYIGAVLGPQSYSEVLTRRENQIARLDKLQRHDSFCVCPDTAQLG